MDNYLILSSFSGLIILPLYSGLSRAEQDLVFSPTPKVHGICCCVDVYTCSHCWCRVLSMLLTLGSQNNDSTIREVDHFVVVLDPLMLKENFENLALCFSVYHNSHQISDIENLVVAPTSKASARQRTGRAGRLRPGNCYRLYTEDYFVNEMPVQGIPEIQRSNLVSCVIQLKDLGIDNILGFDWPEPPSPESMIQALEVLYSLGVLDDDAKLTSPVGFQIAEIPLEPMISKMILASNELGCSEEIITIVAVLSIQSIWFSGRGAQKDLDEAKLRVAAAEGDHVTFLNIYKVFLQSGKSSKWCHKNFVNYHAMPC
ncbi:hypothetical protein CRYUN_Cryun37aG0100200 [Craigia yunnanensis]